MDRQKLPSSSENSADKDSGLGKWSAPRFSDRSVYNRAGKTLVSGSAQVDQLEYAYTTVGDWRAAHQYPLHAIAMTLRGRALEVDMDAIIAQRSKRLVSILPKLERMRLTQIQDIGGCRAVLKDMECLKAVHKIYMDAASKRDSRRTSMEGEPDDYIKSPKRDGYRGIHYVFRYKSLRDRYAVFNGMKIEVQIRTRAQHAWATALEIVDLFTGQTLKLDIDKNRANPEWKKFFRLMGTVIAMNEGCPPVPDTPINSKDLTKELIDVVRKLKAVTLLEGFGIAVKHIGLHPAKNAQAFIVRLDTQKRLLRTIAYDGKRIGMLETDYLNMEKETLDQPHIKIVQIRLKSLDQLKRAYPNYDLDTTAFVNVIKAAVTK